MKINRVKLRGFIGIKKGLGADELELDLSNTSGLIALDGANGHGKTTVLDNLQPYACLASRTGALSHHVFLRDSFRELEFQWNGSAYRTLIKVDAESSRSEGFIFRNGSQQSEVNGKISEYKEYIEKLFGSQNLFFNSVFCAQNADKINDMTTGQLKALFSEFLRLDKLIEYENTSKQCANILTGRRVLLDRDIAKIQDELEGYIGINSRIRKAKSSIDETIHNIASARFTLESNEKDLQQIKSFSAGIEAHKQRLFDLKTQLSKAKSHLSDDRNQTNLSLDEFRHKSSGLREELKGYKDVLGKAEVIRGASEQLKGLSTVLQTVEEVLAANHDKYLKASERRKNVGWEIKKAVEEKERLVSEPEQIKLSMKMDNCREKAKALELKDPACQSTTCSFIKGALEAAKEIPGLEEQYEKRSSKISGLICDLDNKIDGLSSSLTTLEAREDEDRKAWGRALEKRDEIKENISRLESAANKIHELGVAEKISADIAKRIQDVDKEALAIKGAFLTREAQKLEDIKALEASIDGLELNLKHDPTKDIEELEQKISLLQDQISDLDKALAMKKADLAKLETDLDAKAESERRLERLKTDRQAILKEQSEWRYLQLACGKDGLRALEIDSVAPVITGEANKLLLSSFGPRSTVKLRTLDDQGRECLDIEVTDEDGDKVLLSNRSGGQQVWVLKALRLGMAVISQEKSGLDFRTMFADEEDGKLDVKEETESALKFIQLYRSLITRNKVDDVVYITHKPECVAMADHVVRFNGAEVTVS